MKLLAERLRSRQALGDTLAIFAFEDEGRPAAGWSSIDRPLERRFAEAARLEDFKGKEKSLLVFYPEGGRPARRIAVAGLGKASAFDAERLRRAVAVITNRIKGLGGREVMIGLPLDRRAAVAPREQAQAAVEGTLLACYEYSKYKSKPDGKANHLSKIRLGAADAGDVSALREGAERGRIYAEATCLARDLVNEPPSVCTPKYLADAASEVVKGAADIEIKIIDEKEARKRGMGGLLGVSAGSTEPPRFVHMTYKAPGAESTVAVLGKGITFDSGGLCLKPADGMLNMKDDMSGAAAVIGVFRALRELKPRVNVHGIFAASENMPGGGAYKTRDVLRAMNGKTMEIINTDAEGRLVLSDALSYASKLKPDCIVDLATLTGACVVALGPEVSGIFGTDQPLVDRLIASGRATGEKIWQLPLVEEYWDMIKSDVADMKNSGGRWGGSITAALFLKEFVGEGIPWAHIDIAGPALTESSQPYKPAGGTGVGVRTILRFLEQQAGN
ncbi:MAG TPA: leucyl aminopeptidase [Planctomycetota bacterium]|nr:leucyl aminopeptidase [Planctomycetota bacterium]